MHPIVAAGETAELTTRLADVISQARADHGWSVAALAARSGVSRAMIARIERADVQASAVVLAKLSGALHLTLSDLIARAEHSTERLARHDQQPCWTDPDTGYRRTAVSPPAAASPQLTEISLPGHTSVPAPAASYEFAQHQIWVLGGHLTFHEGPEVHELHTGDCLHLGPPQDCVFRNDGDEPVRYLVVVARHDRS